MSHQLVMFCRMYIGVTPISNSSCKLDSAVNAVNEVRSAAVNCLLCCCCVACRLLQCVVCRNCVRVYEYASTVLSEACYLCSESTM
jgi:hypothetical protein